MTSYRRSLKKRELRERKLFLQVLQIETEKKVRRLVRRSRLKAHIRTEALSQSGKKWVFLHRLITRQADSVRFSREYDLLQANPRIAELKVRTGSLRIKTTPVITRQAGRVGGETFYLGVYEIYISLFVSMGVCRLQTLSVTCTDSGRHDGKLQPLYMQNKIGFCFGSRLTFIEERLNAGDLFTAIAVMLDSIWHINEETGIGILSFRKVVDGVIEPAREASLQPVTQNTYPGYMGAGYYG